ncbi:CaiB/BaiF CoA-transferase family protein [Paraburkholderia sp. DHOC27]|uniref:CaiB/BaiF CoA transferase family protein n=1 Tax=Paraburkholderia sp. DHOC27 TaxID=2303330 RepID=UPI000E3E57C5|nr:CaiB/BaiF CoA-transferase family protein [Paraburkholderia sp. DHOC27]RFU48438.1 CoA transferase [Paraburkholderia sp. DHOC27]
MNESLDPKAGSDDASARPDDETVFASRSATESATQATPHAEPLPLEGLRVLDFSQFLAGPSCALRLADLGADVVKIERPQGGDLCRQLYVADQALDGDSVLFHTINRNKRSFAADLKQPADLERVKALVARADVLIHNFRPGVMERLGLGYEVVRDLNARLVYATVTGYGELGPWRDKPGQDLLAQSLSGLTWLSGDATQGPVPVGVSIADIVTGAHLVQGVLAALLRRGVTGRGGRVEVSLMESILDLQFEQITTFLCGDGSVPRRASVNNASVYGAAPYGLYATADGYLALAMAPIPRLAQLLDCAPLAAFDDASQWFARRDEIKAILRDHLATQATAHWLARLEPADIWCAPVQDYATLTAHGGFAALDMTQAITNSAGHSLTTLRCPIRIDGVVLKSPRAAPALGEHTAQVAAGWQIDATPTHPTE